VADGAAADEADEDEEEAVEEDQAPATPDKAAGTPRDKRKRPAVEDPKTPERKSQRTQELKNYAGASTPASGKSRTVKRRKGDMQIEECSCEMPEDWKNAVEAWEKHTFAENRTAVLESMVTLYETEEEEGEDATVVKPCSVHLKTVAFKLGMYLDETDGVINYQIALIYAATKEKEYIRAAWIDSRTRSFFIETDEYDRFLLAHRVSGRFRAKPAPIEAPSNELAVATDILGSDGYHHQPRALEWIYKTGIDRLLIEEMNMLYFHLRQSHKNGSGILSNGYFTLAAQLIWADPMTWIEFLENSKTKQVHFVAHPRPVRYFPAGKVDAAWYEGDSNQLDTTDMLSSEYFLSGGSKRISYCFLKKREDCRNAVAQWLGGEKYSELDVTGNDQNIVQFGNWLHYGQMQGNLTAKIKSIGDGDRMLFRSATTTNRDLDSDPTRTRPADDTAPTVPYITIPVSLVVVLDGENCENGVSHAMLKESHDRLTPPIQGRYRGTEDDSKFECSVRLENVGPIYDMIRGDKTPHHPLVKREIDSWRNARGEARKQLHNDWIVKVVEQVRLAYEVLKDYEKTMFPGNRSYFRCLEDGLDSPTEEVEDPDFMESDVEMVGL
jgi:hypothetical protein